MIQTHDDIAIDGVIHRAAPASAWVMVSGEPRPRRLMLRPADPLPRGYRRGSRVWCPTTGELLYTEAVLIEA